MAEGPPHGVVEGQRVPPGTPVRRHQPYRRRSRHRDLRRRGCEGMAQQTRHGGTTDTSIDADIAMEARDSTGTPAARGCEELFALNPGVRDGA
jgi:hypothetical protein